MIAVVIAWMAVAALRPDEWVALVRTGERLAARGSTELAETGELSARAAYLVAFHHAQDALVIKRMLVAAERLDRLGEADPARHARDVTREVARGLNPSATQHPAWPPPLGPTPAGSPIHS